MHTLDAALDAELVVSQRVNDIGDGSVQQTGQGQITWQSRNLITCGHHQGKRNDCNKRQ